MKKIIWGLVLIWLVFKNGGLVMAEEDKEKTGFSVSPPLVEVVIGEEDKEKSYILNISNDSDKSEEFRLSVVDFGSLEKSAGVAFFGFEKSEIEDKYALASWVRLEKDAFVVDPGQNVSVRVTIVNRESLSPGGHYGAVVIKLEDEGFGNKRLVGVTQNYASLIFVRKTGGEVYRLSLGEVSFGANPMIMTDVVSLRFQNAGNVHLVPRGKIEIKDPKDRLVLKGIINIDSSIIMPESFRDYVTKLNKVERIFWPGRYKMRVDYRYRGRQEFEDYEISFNYWGGWLVWGVVVSALILIMGLVVKTIVGRSRDRK